MSVIFSLICYYIYLLFIQLKKSYVNPVPVLFILIFSCCAPIFPYPWIGLLNTSLSSPWLATSVCMFHWWCGLTHVHITLLLCVLASYRYIGGSCLILDIVYFYIGKNICSLPPSKSRPHTWLVQIQKPPHYLTCNDPGFILLVIFHWPPPT